MNFNSVAHCPRHMSGVLHVALDQHALLGFFPPCPFPAHPPALYASFHKYVADESSIEDAILDLHSEYLCACELMVILPCSSVRK